MPSLPGGGASGSTGARAALRTTSQSASTRSARVSARTAMLSATWSRTASSVRAGLPAGEAGEAEREGVRCGSGELSGCEALWRGGVGVVEDAARKDLAVAQRLCRRVRSRRT